MVTVASSPLFINGDDITAVLREMVDDGGAQILQTMIETGFGVTVLEEEVLFQFIITYLHALSFICVLLACDKSGAYHHNFSTCIFFALPFFISF